MNFEESCMTNMDGVFYEEAASCSTVDIKSEEGRLFQIFRHLSQPLVTYVYEALCNCDFEYSVDYLCSLQEDSATLEYISGKLVNWNNEKFETDELKALGQENADPNMTRKRIKKVQSLDLPIQCSEATYPEHVLNVKRWKAKRNSAIPPQKKDLLEDKLDLPLSWETVNALESFCGKKGVTDRDGIEPVLSLTKSSAEKLYAMWELSVQQQKTEQQKKVDEALANDAAIALAVQDEENAAAGVQMFKDGKNTMDFKNITKSVQPQKSILNSLETEESQESKDIFLSNNVLKYEGLSYEEIIAAAESARNQARRHYEKKADLLSELAKITRNSHDIERQTFYSELVESHRKKMDAANAEAALAFWRAQSMRNNENTFDLHGFRTLEAVTYVDRFIDDHLESMACGMRKQIYIITGKGKNSRDKQSKLKPTVINLLNKRTINFNIDKKNPGMIIAMIRKQS